MLTLDNVTKRYGAGAPAVDGLSLHLPAGVVGLVGHNGAGKTTLMQMIATLARPTTGAILLDGVDIVRKPAAMRARLGYLPQDFGVYPNLSALEFMQYFAALKGVRDPARIRRLLETVNLAQHAHRQAAGFSGGMRRRLGIAQALLNDPDVLVVDEPTAGLDPEERVRFRQLLADLGAHRLVLVSTHIVSDIDSLAAHVAILRGGRLAAFDTPERLIAGARGQVWSASVEADEYELLRGRVHVLQAVRQDGAVAVRIAHPHAPCTGAHAAEPSLEEALMAQRYAVQEQAA
jgi:ABC-2 type transport system ATP-binding protein